jgi:peptidoglycan/LPS O-acetylase OafA/YrhL
MLAAFETLKTASFTRITQRIWMADVFRIAAGILFALVGYGVDFQLSGRYIPLGLLLCAFLLASFHKGLWRSFLSLRLLRFIGNISYSLYLFHIPVLMWVIRLKVGTLWQFTFFVFLSIVVASVAHVCIERPFLSLVKREKN